MSPERKNNLKRLHGITFGGREHFQTWVFGAATFCLLAISGYSLTQVTSQAVFDPPPEPAVAAAAVSWDLSFDSPAAALPEQLPDFSRISDASDRKEAFFASLRPYVDEANRQVLEDRADALRLKLELEANGELSPSQRADFARLLEAYALPSAEPSARTFARLLSRADVVPPSLALAQAALESGWGMSRFARLGNNLFGMWCYEAGCGIVPSGRAEGARHEVAAYPTPMDSFAAYIRNLNTNGAYSDMRAIRAQLRSGGAPLAGVDLAPGLTRYSQEGWEYVGKVQSVILSNGLE